MKLQRLSISNYKSLRDVEFAHTGFTTLIGPNAAGKSNFADALDFLAVMYRHGIEHAIAVKGGYENIAFRRQRRSKSAIYFRIEAILNGFESGLPLRSSGLKRPPREDTLLFVHEFSFRASGTGIRADFSIVDETILLRSLIEDAERMPELFDSAEFEDVRIARDQRGNVKFTTTRHTELTEFLIRRFSFIRDVDGPTAAPQELVAVTPLFGNIVSNSVARTLGAMAVFRLSPDLARRPGVPTPNPAISSTGENLPALVDWLQRKYARQWRNVLQSMQDIVPDLEDITVEYLHTRTLGLFFRERGIGRAWPAEDVSDGTIRTLAMLVATVDPRLSLVVIEEPENSIHPWIIRVLIKHLRSLSARTSVIITTHSPVVIDLLFPEEAWVVHRQSGVTSLRRLTDYDPELAKNWRAGDFRLSEYLDSGLVPQATPIASS